MPRTQDEIQADLDRMIRASERRLSAPYSKAFYERDYQEARERVLGDLDGEARTFVTLAENDQRRVFVDLLRRQFEGR